MTKHIRQRDTEAAASPMAYTVEVLTWPAEDAVAIIPTNCHDEFEQAVKNHMFDRHSVYLMNAAGKIVRFRSAPGQYEGDDVVTEIDLPACLVDLEPKEEPLDWSMRYRSN